MKRLIIELIISILTAAIISIFSEIPFVAWFGFCYSILLIIRMLDALGKRLPFKELIIAITGVQLLVGPFLEYFYFKLKIYGGMSVDAMQYYQYALPCTILLHLGLEMFFPRNDFERKLFHIMPLKAKQNEGLGILLIFIGYGTYLAEKLVQSALPFSFLIELLSFCRFIGFMYLWVSRSKLTVPAFIVVIVPFTIEVIVETLFIQAIVFFTMLMSLYFIKYKVAKVKIYFLFLFISALLILVQSVKYSFRETVSDKSFSGNPVAVLGKTIGDQIANYKSLDLKQVFAHVNVRVNQGWILSDIMNNLSQRPDKIENEYFKREAIGIILPRFIYPEKPMVGDHQKFKEYTGWRLNKKISMSVGLMGDGYGNFGYRGGLLFCLGFGILMGLIFKLWNKYAHIYPTLILWGVLIFFYSMRAGDETYIILNWIVKSALFVFFYFLIFERHNSIRSYVRPNLKPSF